MMSSSVCVSVEGEGGFKGTLAVHTQSDGIFYMMKMVAEHKKTTV